ncbi:MAG: class I SAM-dependent methyltransferase [Bacillota bacterium]
MRNITGSLSRFAYRLMVLTYRLQDAFVKPDAILHEFGIKKGDTVVDFGCGPGRYLRKAAALVGESGRVYAVDIHPLAFRSAAKMAAKYKLDNVIPVLATGGKTEIEGGSADLVYALDMFHQVTEPGPFLAEVRRIVKDNGRFILEDGHQDRKTTRKKLSVSDLWEIESENERYVTLRPVKN